MKERIRHILREVFDSKSTFKRNVYGGEEEYREVTKNRTVIWNPEYKIAFQYIFDDIEVPGYTFVHLYPYTEDGYYYRWDTLENSIKSKIFIDAIKKLPKVLKNYFKKFGKVDNIVFRPKTEQMGNIYSSPSVIRHLESEFGSDYTIEVNTEESSHLPVNTVIMKLKNVEDSINESIKRILREDQDRREKLKIKIINVIKHIGLDYAISMVGGIEKLLDILDIKDVFQFLNLFKDMETEYDQDDDFLMFRFREGLNYFGVSGNNLYVNDNILKVIFHIENNEWFYVDLFIVRWFLTTYNISIKRVYRINN